MSEVEWNLQRLSLLESCTRMRFPILDDPWDQLPLQLPGSREPPLQLQRRSAGALQSYRATEEKSHLRPTSF